MTRRHPSAIIELLLAIGNLVTNEFFW